jgi:hypothetical protein
MKRTQKSVLVGLLALSLAACSYFPWKNTSGTTPATQPSASGTAGGAPGAGNSNGASAPTGQN